MNRLALVTAPIVLLLGACEDIVSKDEPAIYECNFTDTALLPDDTALGTTPNDIAAAMVGVTEHAAVWNEDGSQTTATVDIGLDLAGALLRESSGCGDMISVPGTVSLSTADGGVTSLSVDIDLEWTEAGSGRAWASFEPSDVSGSWTPRALDANETRRGMSLILDYSSGGALTASMNDETEGDDGDVAWASSETVLELDEGFPVL